MKYSRFLAVVATTALPLPLLADAVIVFNEVMYHPATNEMKLEWVELHNQLAVDVDISDWTITGGINYTFPSNSIISGRGYVVIAISPADLAASTGLNNIRGPFTGRLGNNGDTLRLRNNSQRILDEVTYGAGADDDWPVGPDGSGVSLAKRDRDSSSASPANWTVSEQIGGTPGAQNFAPANVFVAPPGLVSYWSFDESGSTALDAAGQNHGTLGSGATRSAGQGISGAISFNGTANAYVNVGPGVANNFAVTNGLTLEAVLQTTWNGSGTATLFRKAPVRPTNYTGAVLASAPLSYWRLNDTTVNIADTMPAARTGAATAGVQLSQPGLLATDPANNAIRVSGTERVVVPGFEKIGAAGYTVEYWVKPNVLPVGCCQNLVGDGEAAGDYFMMNYILGPPQGLTGAVRPHFGPGNTPVSLDGVTALQVGKTYHVVTTWDTSKATDNAMIYLNGVVDRVGTITRNVPTAGTTGANKVYIGKDDRDTSDGNNTIDEVAVYNRPLSSTEIAGHYLAGTLANFDQNQGNAILLAFQNDGNNAQAVPPVPAGPVLSFGLAVNGTYAELDMPLDGQSGRPTLAALQNGSLHHVAATFNPQTGLKAIYIDGVLAFSTTVAGALNANNPANAVIGNGEVNGTTPLSGALDEVAYWGRALSSSEVAAHSGAIQAGRNYFAAGSGSATLALLFNEVTSPTNLPFFVELINSGSQAIALGEFSLRHDGIFDHVYNFPASNLSPSGLIAVTSAQLGFVPAAGDKFFLVHNPSGRVVDGVVVSARNRARFPNESDGWGYPSQATPGGVNIGTFHTEIVINEIMYSHMVLSQTNSNQLPQPSAEEWVELYNRGATTVDLGGWELGGGISYRFSAGQLMAPGAYLVVARDAAALRSTYPGITIVGDYNGGLSGRGDRVVLRDLVSNTADEVRYFDGGRWPEYADGLGSSMELRDPNADNSKAEAWAASDETGKSTWQTFTYRMLANIPSGNSQPTTWQDFILGLQSAGECLIDDISVIETPTTTPVQVIANGDFSSGLSGWRNLGTHVHSQVEPDPDSPGNNVLHLVATGPQEHMHNHIERTLNAGRTIVTGREYEISFRARWLAGNNLLNTRLYFNRSGRTTVLPVPPRNGTPGAQNSRFTPNIGPTFSDFAHSRVVPAPGEAVTVTVKAEDPQNVASVQVFWSVNSGSWSSATMTADSSGRYTGTIPGQAAGAVVQFYVRATDGQGASSTYPALGADSGAIYKVNDGQAILSLAHNVRLILTPTNIDLMHGTAQGVNQTNVMSNDLLPCTVIYDETRAYYDCRVHLRGSQRGRYSDIRTGFHIEFPPDDLFRGVNPVMLIDRSGAGDATANRQEEIVLKHILNRAGDIPGTYSEICRIIAPRSAHTGPAQFFPRHEDAFIESAYENGGDGQLFEMELIYYPTTANAAGYKNPQPDSVLGTDMTNLGDDKEFYRYNFMIKNNRDLDDYSRFVALCKSWSLTGTALDTQTKQLMDIDQWMRAYALVSLCSVGDMYSFGNNHNFFTYSRPSDGKFVYFPWDMDFAFTRGSTGALVGDQNVAKVVNLPGNLRRLYAHMQDIIGVSFNSAYMAYWTAHYASFAPGQNYANSLNTIAARVPFVNSTINGAGGNSPFVVAGTNMFTTNANLILLSGTAPVAVQSIRINGQDYPLAWSSISAWSVKVPLSGSSNQLEITAFDVKGRPLTNLTKIVTVFYTGPQPRAEDSLVINEIMYNPTTPEASYVEILNRATDFTFDLSGWRINGLDFTFPSGTYITNGGLLVVAKNAAAFASVYGASVPLAGTFDGQLDDGGETLTLIKPGATPAGDVTVDRVKYDDDAPWPLTADGLGTALQLIDASQDNSRVANWGDGSGWKLFTYTAGVGASALTRLSLFFEVLGGDVYLDDMVLVQGSTPNAGQNVLVNGDFENGLTGWLKTSVGTNSEVVADAHTGNGALHLILLPGAQSLTAFYQDFPSLTPSTNYTLSFWYRSGNSGTNLNLRINTLFRAIFNPSAVPFSPGLANPSFGPKPPFPALWLNEAQPQNTSGIVDNQGEREPWIELYNAGLTPIDLAGYYLANNYTNLTQWAFPPGATIQPGQFRLIFADGEPGETTAGEWHANFRLSAGTGSLALGWTPPGSSVEVLDYFNYAAIPAGRSYGAFPDGQPFDRQEFYRVTPGVTNDNTAAPIVAYINEWMAANSGTLINTNNNNRFDDWFELYNPGAAPVSLSGYYLTDNLSNKTQFAIPPGFTIPANGYLLVWADNSPDANNTNIAELHVNFRLDQGGEALGLFASDGTRIDAVIFEGQFTDRSQGRFPNGTGPQYFLLSPTPAGPNTSWANRYPVLAPIANALAVVGQPLSFTASATDPDGNSLVYSLDTAPAGATVNPTTGLFSWTPTVIGTNTVVLEVTDNGTPALTAGQTFVVTVMNGILITGGSVDVAGGNVSFTVGTAAGKTYRVEYKMNLNDTNWQPLGPDRLATGSSLTVTDVIGANPQRFYRVIELP